VSTTSFFQHADVEYQNTSRDAHRIQLERNEQDPASTDPNIQVAGYFTTGGSAQQALNYRERDLEIDDDILQSAGKHELKAGAQALGIFVHDFDPSFFNGSYVFGGGAAPTLDINNAPTGQIETVTPYWEDVEDNVREKQSAILWRSLYRRWGAMPFRFCSR